MNKSGWALRSIEKQGPNCLDYIYLAKAEGVIVFDTVDEAKEYLFNYVAFFADFEIVKYKAS